jgi:hypothetical protein
MKRFFFDVAMQSSTQYDFRGKDLATTEEARELAELIALDIECTSENNMTAFEVQVRNVTGDSLFKVPVRCLAAA